MLGGRSTAWPELATKDSVLWVSGGEEGDHAMPGMRLELS